MKLLRDLWRALTTPAESMVSACNYGIPLRTVIEAGDRPGYGDSAEKQLPWAEAAMRTVEEPPLPLSSEPFYRKFDIVDPLVGMKSLISEKLAAQIDADIMAMVAREAQEKAVMDAMLYGTGAVKIEVIDPTDFRPWEIDREVRVVKNETDINPVSGIPYSDAARKELQLDTFMFEYFPDAWLAVARVAIEGNRQHNPGQPLHWARSKSKDQFNTAFRHYWERRRGVHKDMDGQPHLAKAIWRLMAQLQLDIEAVKQVEEFK